MDPLDFFCITLDNLNLFSCIKTNYCPNCHQHTSKETKCLWVVNLFPMRRSPYGNTTQISPKQSTQELKLALSYQTWLGLDCVSTSNGIKRWTRKLECGPACHTLIILAGDAPSIVSPKAICITILHWSIKKEASLHTSIKTRKILMVVH